MKEIMMNWKGDAVIRDQLPPPVAKAKSLETPLQRLIIDRLIFLIPKQYWLPQRR